jgi:hypothetical protein
MVNFYRRFLPGIARTLQPLTDALKDAPKMLEWPPAAAFGAAKAALAAAVPLAHPALNAVLSLATDASDTHVGGVLQPTADRREMAAAGVLLQEVVGGGQQVLHLRQGARGRFQRGQTFQILTGGATVPPTDRPQAARHIPVPHNAVVVDPPAAATLLHRRINSRHQTHTRPGERGSGRLEPPAFSNRAAAAAEPTALSRSHRRGPARRGAGGSGSAHPGCHRRCTAGPLFGDGRCAAGLPGVAEMMNSSTLQITTQTVGDTTLLGDVSTGVFRPLVPIQHREAVFQSLHSIHHPGVRVTRCLIAARFCWPQMAKAITQMARACLQCQRGKVHRHVHLKPTEIPVPHRRFAHLHVDLVGPLPPSRGHTYLFTIIDRTSPPSPPPTAPGPSSPAGYHASEYQPPSLQTEGPNSLPLFGRACAACSTSSTRP